MMEVHCIKCSESLGNFDLDSSCEAPAWLCVNCREAAHKARTISSTEVKIKYLLEFWKEEMKGRAFRIYFDTDRNLFYITLSQDLRTKFNVTFFLNPEFDIDTIIKAIVSNSNKLYQHIEKAKPKSGVWLTKDLLKELVREVLMNSSSPITEYNSLKTIEAFIEALEKRMK